MGDPNEKFEPGVGSNGVRETEDTVPMVGSLDFDEYTRGGLGRHLGIFSTIFLM